MPAEGRAGLEWTSDPVCRLTRFAAASVILNPYGNRVITALF